MEKIYLLVFCVGLPSAVYLGIKLEIWRRRKIYKNKEENIRHKYQENLFSIEKNESPKKEDYKKAS